MFGNHQEGGWPENRSDEEDTTDESNTDYDLLAWVMASEHRQDILSTLQEGPKNTTHFRKEWDVSTADVPRRYISDLEERDLVQCVTPERDRYRLYELTETGEQMAEQL